MGLTARGPAPSSRTEATAAFEAAVVEKLWGYFPRSTSAHARKFEKALNGKRKWFLFAEETFPNRGEVSVQTLEGEILRVPVLLGPGLRKSLRKEGWLISTRYPEIRERQVRWVKEGREFTLAELLTGELKHPDKGLPKLYSYWIKATSFTEGSAPMIQETGLIQETSLFGYSEYLAVESRANGILLAKSQEAAEAYEDLNPGDLVKVRG